MLAQTKHEEGLEEFESQTRQAGKTQKMKRRENEQREESPLYHTANYEGYYEIIDEWDNWCMNAFNGDCSNVHYEIGE